MRAMNVTPTNYVPKETLWLCSYEYDGPVELISFSPEAYMGYDGAYVKLVEGEDAGACVMCPTFFLVPFEYVRHGWGTA